MNYKAPVLIRTSVIVIALVAAGVLLSIVVYLGSTQGKMGEINNTQASALDCDKEITVYDPVLDDQVLVNQLTILGPGAQGAQVQALVTQSGGVICLSVPETDTYQAPFPVSDLPALDRIASKLKAKGFEVLHSIVPRIPGPGEPQ